MTKLGELLKSEREKRSLSLHEIGMSLKINPKILKAIEDGDQSNLPAKTFLRGFVKSYAQYLRLDVNQTLQLFQEEYGGGRVEPIPSAPADGASTTPSTSAPQASHPHGVPHYENPLKRPNDAALPVGNKNRTYTIIFAIVLLGLIGFVAKMMDKYQKESRTATEVVETSTTTTLAGTDAAAGAATTESTSTTLPGESTTTTSSTSSTSTTSESTTTTAVKTHAMTPMAPVVTTTSTTSTTARPTTTSTTLHPTTTTTTSSSTTTSTNKGPSTEVIIEALNKVSIRFSLNGGQKWETLELNADQVHTFRSRTSVQFEFSDGGAVNVIVNGRDRGVPGTIGKPLKLNYP